MSKFKRVGAGILAMGIAALLSGAAAASDRGSAEDQMACTPDVYRLCSSYVPDEDAIVACLKRNVRTLSLACQKVMTRPSAPSDGGSEEDTD